MILCRGLWGLVNHPVCGSLVPDVPMLLWLGCRTSGSGCDLFSLGFGWGRSAQGCLLRFRRGGAASPVAACA